MGGVAVGSGNYRVLETNGDGIVVKREVRLPSGERVTVTAADLAQGIPQMLEHEVVVRQVDGRDTRVALRYFYICRDAEVRHFTTWWRGMKAAGERRLGWDTETSGIHVLKEKVATVQFGNPLYEDPRAYVCDVRALSKEALDEYLAPVEDPDTYLFGQNLKFETLYAMHHLGKRPKKLVDTQVTELVLRAGLLPGGDGGGENGQDRRAYGAASMAKLVQRYCGPIDLDKDHDLRVSFYVTPVGGHDIRQIVYAGSDVVHPFYIYEAQKKEIEARALRSILITEYELIPVLAEMELRGMAFDRESWTALWQEAVEAHDKAQRKLDALFLGIQPDLFGGTDTNVRPLYTGGKGKNAKPTPLNWSSSSQIKWALRQWCLKANWPVTLLLTDGDVRKAKAKEGLSWLSQKGKIRFDEDGKLLTPLTDELLDDIPEFVLPEDRYCVLVSADSDVLTLRLIRRQLPREFVELLLEYGEQKARISTFGIDFLKNVWPDGRVRFEFHQVIAATGRLSASPNSMNIPRDKRYRDCFIAAKGKRLCISDYSQQEPRTSAYVSGDEVYRRNYERDEDLYITIAEELFGYRPDPASEDTEFKAKSKRDRQASKSTVLGMAYRMGAGKLRNKLTLDLNAKAVEQRSGDYHDVPFDHAYALWSGFLEKCSGIKVYQELCHRQADPESPAAQRVWDLMLGAVVTWIESPCGRKRFFPPDAKNTYTEACNLPIQACGATMTKSAMVLISREIERRGWIGRAWIVNAVHDELVVEADADIAPHVAQMMKQEMERAGAYYVKDVKIVASFPTDDGTSDRWVKD